MAGQAWKIGLAALAAIGALGLGGATYLGAFAPVVVSEQETGPYYFVYEEMAGTDPQQIGQITTRIEQTISDNHWGAARPLDIFNPPGGEANQIGFALEAQLPEGAQLPANVHARVVPKQRAMVARFPWRSSLSFFVGYMRVGPALTNYRAAHGYRDGPAYTLNEGAEIAYIQPAIDR